METLIKFQPSPTPILAYKFEKFIANGFSNSYQSYNLDFFQQMANQDRRTSNEWYCDGEKKVQYFHFKKNKPHGYPPSDSSFDSDSDLTFDSESPDVSCWCYIGNNQVETCRVENTPNFHKSKAYCHVRRKLQF